MKEGQKFLELCLLVLITASLRLALLLCSPMTTQVFAKQGIKTESFIFEAYDDKATCPQSFQILTVLRSTEFLLRRRRPAKTFYSIIKMGHLGFMFSFSQIKLEAQELLSKLSHSCGQYLEQM